MGRSKARMLALGIVAALAAALPVSPALAAETGDPDFSADAVPGQLLIKFASGTAKAEREQTVAEENGEIVARSQSLGVDAAKFKGAGAGLRGIARELERDPDVVYAEPNFIARAAYTPNDPSLGSQWAWAKIGAFTAWDTTQGSSSVSIAIADTGIQRSHPDLDAKIVAGYDFVQGDSSPDDGNGHGTHVAGTAAAETNNSTGGAGTCPACRLMPVRVLGNDGSGTWFDVANGIRWAADHGAQVINLSLAGPASSTLESAINYAVSRNVFLACAAGNENTSNRSQSYPAGYSSCFSVAATTSSDSRASFSNYGSWVDAAAPGSSIYSTYIGNGYQTWSGTSMATPHVAGLAGLLTSQGLSGSQIANRICSTSDAISGTGSYWTCGRINAQRAVGGSTEPPPPPPPPPPSGSDVIVNGGFESGLSPWSQTSSGGYDVVDTEKPHTGSFSAWLGGYTNGTDKISQTVAVPAGSTLSYWWHLSTNESRSRAYDYLRVRLYNSSGSLLSTLRTFSNTSSSGQWRQDSLGLSSYAGQTVRVEFEVTNNNKRASSFFVDDVSLK